MSSLPQLRAFTNEMVKMATNFKDAEIQKLLAERRGEEYLEGGRLPSNSADEVKYFPKMAYDLGAAGMAATGSYDLHASKKKRNSYQSARDYATTGMKGGLTGLGLLGASNAMRGRFGAPSGARQIATAARNARRAAGAGATVAIADRAYRHDDLPGTEKKAWVDPAPGQLRTPKMQLAQSQATGSFKNVIHDAGKFPKAVQIGRKFRI